MWRNPRPECAFEKRLPVTGPQTGLRAKEALWKQENILTLKKYRSILMAPWTRL